MSGTGQASLCSHTPEHRAQSWDSCGALAPQPMGKRGTEMSGALGGRVEKEVLWSLEENIAVRCEGCTQDAVGLPLATRRGAVVLTHCGDR